MRSLPRLGVVLVWLVLICVMAPAASAAQEQSIFGTLNGPEGPVQGAEITVMQNGNEIGSATSAADGTWRVPVEEPGTYDVTIDPGSLPNGVVLRTAGEDTLTGVVIQPGENRAVIFALSTPAEQQQPGEETTAPDIEDTEETQLGEAPAGASFATRFLRLTVAGVMYGSIIAITAIGLSLIFGTTRMINFAHGEFVTLGAVIAYFFNAYAGGPGLGLVAAAVVAVLLLGLTGGATEKWLWRPLRKRSVGRIQLFIISIGLSLLIRHLILVFFGSRAKQYNQFTLQESISLGPISATPRDLVILALSLLALVGVGLMLQRTRIGKAMRAVSDNKDLAAASGINVDRVVLVVWALGGALAGLGGVFFGLAEVIQWDMGFRLLLLMFAAVILGGLGTAYGAVVGAFVIGLIAQWSTLWFPVDLQTAWALLVMIVVLIIRPQGIFGRRERIG